MSTILFTEQTTPSSPTVGKVRLFIDSNDSTLKSVDYNGVITAYVGTSDERIQDVVGALITAGSTKVLVNYNDLGAILSIDIDPTQIDHTALLNIGTNTHAQIDTHIANTSNPHSVTKTQVGLSNVQNLDQTNPANITQDATHRFVTDTEKSTWNGKQDAITGAATTITSSNLTASRALASDASGKVAVSSVTSTELGYVSGVTSAIQTQLGNKVTSNTVITGATNTKITYDAKGLVTSGTSANLDDLGDVIIATPATNDVLQYNGANWVNNQLVPTTNGGAGVDLFLSATASGISGYDLMSRTPDTVAEVDESIAVVNTTSPLLFETYIQDAAIGSTSVDPGIWSFNLYLYATPQRVGHTTSISISAYTRTTGGTETLLFTTTSADIVNTAVTLYNIVSTQTAFSCNATDKLVFKMTVSTTDTSSVTVHLVHSGTTHYSNINTPLITRHNDLAGLQGGSSAQYYHLTSAEYAGTGTGVFVRTTNPNITSPTGIIKGDVGLGNVDNTSDATKNSATVTLTNKTISGASNTISNIGYSSLSLTGSIVDGDVSSSAAIAVSKLAALTTGRVVQTNITTGKIEASTITDTELGYLSGVTSAIQTQLGTKAPLASPALTGTPTAPTATVGTNTTQIATTAFVLANGPTPSDATTVSKGIIQLAGDLANTATSPTVVGLQTRSVATTAPTNGQTLTWNSTTSKWEPQTVAGGAGSTLVTVSASNLALSSSSTSYQLFVGTVHGQSVTLPDATTLSTGDDYFLANKSDTVIPVFYNGATLACFLYPDQYLECLVMDNSTTAGKWVIESAVPNPLSQININDDFISSGTASGAIGQLGWTLVTGTTAMQASTGSARGVLRINSTIANSGTVAIHNGLNNFLTTSGVIVYEARVSFPTLGGATTAGYTARFGLGDTTGNADQANGIYFEYLGTVAGTVNWSLKTASASTRTTTATSVAVAAATYYKLTWVLNSAGNSVGFYINGTYIASIATNIPTTAIGILSHITTNATNAAAKSADIDYIYCTQNYNTVR